MQISINVHRFFKNSNPKADSAVKFNFRFNFKFAKRLEIFTFLWYDYIRIEFRSTAETAEL